MTRIEFIKADIVRIVIFVLSTTVGLSIAYFEDHKIAFGMLGSVTVMGYLGLLGLILAPNSIREEYKNERFR